MLDRLSLFSNRLSIRVVLLTGFATVIALGLMTTLLTEWAASVADRTMDRFVNVDQAISEICFKSTAAMITARRYEKDFLLTYKEFGYAEARSRYINRVRTALAGVKESMERIRLLSDDPETVRRSREVDQAIDQYQSGLLSMVEKHGALGSFDSGLEGAMRARARKIEDLLRQQKDDRLMANHLMMRMSVDAFIERNRDGDVEEFQKAAVRFDNELAASGTPMAIKAKLRDLTRVHRTFFEQYVRTSEAIRTLKEEYLQAVQTIEPSLETLYRGSLDSIDISLTRMKRAEGALKSIKIITLLLFLVSLFVAFAVSSSVSASAEALRKADEDRKQSDSRIRFLAYYDGLTGLPNRMFFQELLKKTLAAAQRYSQSVSILYLDLDDFKRVNDTLGHPIGDKLLQAVSERLVASVRSSDIVTRSLEADEHPAISRLGGDEFVILLLNAGNTRDVSMVARRLLKEIAKPFDLDGHEVFTSASMGISIFPSGGKDSDELLKNADTAMYQAKAKGKNSCQFYTEAMNAAALELFRLESDLHRALERQEFLLHYQPKIDASGRTISGMEALIRWNHKEKGMIAPMKFIPLAEDTGLIVPIGEWVLRTACHQAKAWVDAGMKNMNMSINLSARQFEKKDLSDMIEGAIKEASLSPRHLELEVTESMVMRKPDEAIVVLRALKDMGVTISIDDFGTGYSSLNYLRKLPVDSVKIDRSFIVNAAENSEDAAIVKGIIALAHGLRLKVIAEGVETEEQFAFLRRVECDEVQGYLFGKPVPAEEFLAFLKPGQA